MLELAERLADLHIKRARTLDLWEKAAALMTDRPAFRKNAAIYRHASSVLFDEIKRVEALYHDAHLDAEG